MSPQGIQKGTSVILPQFITLRDTGNYYMTVYPGTDLNWMLPYGGGKITLKGANGKIVNQYNSPDSADGQFRCTGDGGGAPFEIIHVNGNQIYLRSCTSTSVFMTSRQAGNLDGVAGSAFAGDEALFTVFEPIISKEIIDVDYDIPNPVLWDVPATIALNTTVTNTSDSDSTQETLAYSYQRSKVGTWNNTAGIELGVETSFKADVPFLASGGVKVSLKGSYSHQWGGSEGTQETVTSSTEITVPPKKSGKVTVLVKNKAMDIKFSYKLKIVYQYGTTKITDKDGVYHNVESYEVDVQVGDLKDV